MSRWSVISLLVFLLLPGDVQAVTGITIEQWSAGKEEPSFEQNDLSCDKVVALLKSTRTVFVAALEQHVIAGALQPWGAILGANNSRSEILARYAVLQQRYANALTGREPILIERRRSALPRYQVRVGADTRAAANELCRRIHTSGGDCVVLRNPRT
jgi:sporulation related protein